MRSKCDRDVLFLFVQLTVEIQAHLYILFDSAQTETGRNYTLKIREVLSYPPNAGYFYKTMLATMCAMERTTHNSRNVACKFSLENLF